MDISMDDTHIYLSMHKYIENTLELLDFTQLKPVRTPINADIDGSSPTLKPHMLRKFMTAVGCIGWLCNTGRPDIAYAHSRVAQHMAKPTESAWTVVKRIFQYLQGTKTRCLSAPLNEPCHATVHNARRRTVLCRLLVCSLFGQPEAVVTTDVQSEGAILECTLNTHAAR